MKRSLKHADWGRLPEILNSPEMQLNTAEKIVITSAECPLL